MKVATRLRKQARAAELLAQGSVPLEVIRDELGIAEATLWRWQRDPVVIVMVDEAREKIRAAIRAEGIANKQHRIDALNERHRLMTEVIAARAQAHQWRSRAAQDADPDGFDFQAYTAAGAETGLMVHTVTYSKDGRREEWAVDTGLLKELREHEKQAAQEVGQLEPYPTDGNSTASVTINQTFDYRTLIAPISAAPDAPFAIRPDGYRVASGEDEGLSDGPALG